MSDQTETEETAKRARLKTLRDTVTHLIPKIKSNPIEKDVKKAVKEIVLGMAPNAYIFMPVQSGYGSPDLDFIITLNGFDLRVETKVAGRKPTERQKITSARMSFAGIPVLWIDQNNLDDLAVILDLLLTGKQGEAVEIAIESRREFLNGKQTQTQTQGVRG